MKLIKMWIFFVCKCDYSVMMQYFLSLLFIIEDSELKAETD